MHCHLFGTKNEIVEYVDRAQKVRADHFYKFFHENRLSQSREQWTDGANLFAIAPKVLIGYDPTCRLS